MNRGVYRLARVRPAFSLGVRWVLGLAWVVCACGGLRDVCWACWRRARSREPRRHASRGTPSATISGLLGGAMVVSSNWWVDWRPFLRRPHYLAVAPAPGSFLSVVRSGGRLRRQHPRPSSGQGQTAIRRRPIGGPSGLARIVGNAPNARHRSSSAAYLRL